MKRGQTLYVIEAALEYLIAILASGSFLATLTRELGMSDSLTGILSSVISLGCLFQLLSIFVRRRTVKWLVVILSVVNQLLFTLLYVAPVLSLSKTAKTAIFIVLILGAYLLYYIAHPKKIAWLMSLVPDGRRGRFTANKEIISLVVGVAFSYGMGSLFDHLTAYGMVRTALTVGALTILALTVGHTLTMIFTVERSPEEPEEPASKPTLKQSFAQLCKNRRLLSVIVISILYNVAHYTAMPFYATYQIGELGMSLQLIAVLGICGSASRMLVSKFWGRYADRRSFAAMIEKCFVALGLAYVAIMFAVPANGRVMFALYYVLNGIAMGGINSALTNMIFDYVPHESRANSLAICQAIAGVVGFLSTLAVSPLVSYIQGNGNRVLGISMYAQQFISIISVLFVVLSILYVRGAILNKAKALNKE